MKPLTKRQMLERVQFSKNMQVALRAAQILANKLGENEVKGMFFDAILRDDYKDALMRADENNRRALEAKDFTVARMRCTTSRIGFTVGDVYYLKLCLIDGFIEVTPTVDSDGIETLYPTMTAFLYEWSPNIY